MSETIVAIENVLGRLSHCPTPGASAPTRSDKKLGCVVTSDDRDIKVGSKFRVDAKAEMALIEAALEKAISRWSPTTAKSAQEAQEGGVPEHIKKMTLSQKVGEFQRLYNTSNRQKQLSQLSDILSKKDDYSNVEHNLKVDRLPGIRTLTALKFVTELNEAQDARDKGASNTAAVTPDKKGTANDSPPLATKAVEVSPPPAAHAPVTPLPLKNAVSRTPGETITDSKGQNFELGISKDDALAFNEYKKELESAGFKIEFGKKKGVKTISLSANNGKSVIGSGELHEPMQSNKVTETLKEFLKSYQLEIKRREEAKTELSARTTSYPKGNLLSATSVTLPDTASRKEFDALMTKRAGVGKNYSVEVSQGIITLTEKKTPTGDNARSFKGKWTTEGIQRIEIDIASHENQLAKTKQERDAKTLTGEIVGDEKHRSAGIILDSAETVKAANALAEKYKGDFLIRARMGTDNKSKFPKCFLMATKAGVETQEVVLNGTAAVAELEKKMLAAQPKVVDKIQPSATSVSQAPSASTGPSAKITYSIPGLENVKFDKLEHQPLIDALKPFTSREGNRAYAVSAGVLKLRDPNVPGLLSLTIDNEKLHSKNQAEVTEYVSELVNKINLKPKTVETPVPSPATSVGPSNEVVLGTLGKFSLTGAPNEVSEFVTYLQRLETNKKITFAPQGVLVKGQEAVPAFDVRATPDVPVRVELQKLTGPEAVAYVSKIKTEIEKNLGK